MGVCDVPVISSVCDAVGEGAATLVAAPFDWLAQAMGAAAGWLFEAVWSVFDTTTLVDVTKPGYVAVYNLLFGIAVFVMLIFFCLQLITGLIRRDPTALTRAALGLAKSVLGSFVVITLTAIFGSELYHEYAALACAALERGHNPEEVQTWLWRLREAGLRHLFGGTSAR